MSERSTVLKSRYGKTVIQFIKFGLVGGSGVIVNMIALAIATKLGAGVLDVGPKDSVMNLLGTRFNVRWYHVFCTIAFVVANTWNFQINRWWTFKSSGHGRWWREFLSFFATGLLSYVVSLAVTTLLMNPTSPLELSPRVFDNSSGLRTQVYWANMIGILVAMPINFIINKLWTFRAVRTHKAPKKYELLTEEELAEKNGASKSESASLTSRLDNAQDMGIDPLNPSQRRPA